MISSLNASARPRFHDGVADVDLLLTVPEFICSSAPMVVGPVSATVVTGAFGVDVAVGSAVGSPSPVFDTLARGVTI